jgi:hypothetical protein
MNLTERQRVADLCEAIVSEKDPRKMAKLMQQLNFLLEAKQERLDQAKAERRAS